MVKEDDSVFDQLMGSPNIHIITKILVESVSLALADQPGAFAGHMIGVELGLALYRANAVMADRILDDLFSVQPDEYNFQIRDEVQEYVKAWMEAMN